MQPGATGKIAPVLIGAPIADGAEELVQQISVRAVQLNEIKTGLVCPPCPLDKGVADFRDLRRRHLRRSGSPLTKCHGRGPALIRPAALFHRNHPPHRRPGSVEARFAPGMGQLNRSKRAVPLNHPHDMRQSFDVLVLPNPQVLGRNASLGFNSGRLGHHQSASARRPRPQVNQVPVVGKAIVTAVHAHGRERDTIAHRPPPLGERSKQGGHGFSRPPF